MSNQETTVQWLQHVNQILLEGNDISNTRELINSTFAYDTDSPIINVRQRRINYKFMAAEARYILTGMNDASRLDTAITYFSDNYSEVWPFQQGAYGPMVVDQLPWVIRVLQKDIESRQAVMSIWRPRPAPNPDIPCTLTLQFIIRDDELNTIANMRSSDAFMGLIYDTFVFAQISRLIASYLEVNLGTTYINAGSSHIYHKDIEKAEHLIGTYSLEDIRDGRKQFPASFHSLITELEFYDNDPTPLARMTS